MSESTGATHLANALPLGTEGPWSPNRALMPHQQGTVREIVRCIEEGTYVTLLGPHYSGKTLLVQAVAEIMAQPARPPCVYVDLSRLSAVSQRGFFESLSATTAERLAEQIGRSLAAFDMEPAGSAGFRGLLNETVAELQNDLVLILDHLEALPGDLAQVLLTSLRAAYMEQQTLDYRLVVVASGALSLAGMAVGESSPFRGIARRVFVADLSEEQSAALIAEQLASEEMQASERAEHSLLHATRGDPYLLRRICRDAIRAAQATSSGRLTVQTVDQTVRKFLDDEVEVYAPLQEAVRAIEDDPDLLRCVLLLLERGAMPRSELPLPLSPDADPLYLTGVVERLEGDRYRLRNDIYRRTLARRLDPGRVGHLLTMAGRWDSAIDYLEASIGQGNDGYRADLLPATIHSMYASEDLGHAAHFLLRGLSAGFGVEEAQVWMASRHEPSLRLVGQLPAGTRYAVTGGGQVETMGLQEDRLEARAYRDASPLRGQEGTGSGRRAIPLLVPGQRPVGVVCLVDRIGEHFSEQRERERQLLGYLHQAARALQQVSKRTQELALAGRVQSSLLPPVPHVPGWQLAAALLPARQTSGDFYDLIPLRDGRLGLVVADVTDKGMGAALYMALSRTLIRTYAAQYPGEPARVLAETSRRMLQDAGAGLFVTAFYGVLDPTGGEMVYCNAGHPQPVWISNQDGGAVRSLAATGMALGAVEDAAWQQERVRLAPSDLVLLYTDGLLDANNHESEFFGRQRVLNLLRERGSQTASEIQEALINAVSAFTGDEPAFDDMTLVVLRREEAGRLQEALPRRAATDYPTFRARVI